MNGRQIITKSKTLRGRLWSARWPKETPLHQPIPEGYHAVDGFCEFRRFVKYTEWTWNSQPTAKMAGPEYGDPPRNQAVKRCPLCGKRLKLRANFCVGGEFRYWELPDHKPRETRKPGPRRKSRTRGRGK